MDISSTIMGEMNQSIVHSRLGSLIMMNIILDFFACGCSLMLMGCIESDTIITVQKTNDGDSFLGSTRVTRVHRWDKMDSPGSFRRRLDVILCGNINDLRASGLP
jgi:hypothetical protein